MELRFAPNEVRDRENTLREQLDRFPPALAIDNRYSTAWINSYFGRVIMNTKSSKRY